ncbi:hypothetical protein SLEP1_g3855 [Rubroshorea leprosula]|uniref:Uncharacterized protein n=1 Tax=Rubroshorea leprosula TaxID=152421 RepID=A0AAV5HSK1_9ROSI|nr:hypothetical protein SLEP1_g3855 [Rubroshorea leprosula]
MNPARGVVAMNPARGVVAMNPTRGFVAMNPARGVVAMNPTRGFVAMNPTRGFATNPGAWIRDDTSSAEKLIENSACVWVRDLAEIENPAYVWVCREPKRELGSLPTQSHELGSL